MKLRDALFLIGAISVLIGATSKPTAVPNTFSETLTLEEREIEISSRTYSVEESKKYLHLDLIGKGYVPVEITIQNQGDHAYALSQESSSMTSAHPEDVAWKVTKGSIPRSVGFKVLSFFFWPFTIPSALDTIHSMKKHGSIVDVLTAKGLKEEDEIILPYSLVKRVLYVPQEIYTSRFTFTLEDVETKQILVGTLDANA